MTDELRKALEAYDLTCDNFWANPREYDLCIKNGRTVDAEFGADHACWPCMIRVAIAASAHECPEFPQGTVLRHHVDGSHSVVDVASDR